VLDLTKLRDAIRWEGGVSRRLFLAYGTALSAIPLLGTRVEGRVVRRPRLAADPFTCGVASGEPSSTGVVLWTRLAPEPLSVGGGMAPEKVEVKWELAEDEGM